MCPKINVDRLSILLSIRGDMTPSTDIIKDFSRLQCDISSLSASNIALAQKNARLRAALAKLASELRAWNAGNPPTSEEAKDILPNDKAHPQEEARK